MVPLPTTVEAWLAWQERLNPAQIDLGLDRLRPVASCLGLNGPHGALITVAGTNGKGSTVAFLEALAHEHGLHSASYSSPWMLSYNESVRIGGVPVSDSTLLESFTRVENARGRVPLTAFEFRTLAALDIAVRARPDLTILEVGLGGRLDAVNLFDADVAIISSIGLDHAEWLGRTRRAVAREKAGIMRRGHPAVCADAPSARFLAPEAARIGARLVAAPEDLRWRVGRHAWRLSVATRSFAALPRPTLIGTHQLRNAAGAIAAFCLLPGGDRARDEAVARALRRARLAGRLQRLPGRPERRLDVAHNAQAAAALARWLDQRGGSARVIAVCAMYADKRPGRTVKPLVRRVDAWYVAPLPPPRGASAEQLADALRRRGARRVERAASVEEAYQAAMAEAHDQDLVLVFGSFETVRAVLRLESAAGTLDT